MILGVVKDRSWLLSGSFSEKKSVAGIRNIFELLMTMVQRKYKIIKDSLLKGLTEEVNEQIQREYKDKEGFLYQSSGRWQCLGAPFFENGLWHQALVFLQQEDE